MTRGIVFLNECDLDLCLLVRSCGAVLFHLLFFGSQGISRFDHSLPGRYYRESRMHFDGTNRLISCCDCTEGCVIIDKL